MTWDSALRALRTLAWLLAVAGLALLDALLISLLAQCWSAWGWWA